VQVRGGHDAQGDPAARNQVLSERGEALLNVPSICEALEGAARQQDHRVLVGERQVLHGRVVEDRLEPGRRHVLPAKIEQEFRDVAPLDLEARLQKNGHEPPGAAARIHDEPGALPDEGLVERVIRLLLGVNEPGQRVQIVAFRERVNGIQGAITPEQRLTQAVLRASPTLSKPFYFVYRFVNDLK
jgi:hypothetical protein